MTGAPFGIAYTVLLLGMIVWCAVVVDANRMQVGQRRTLLGTTALLLVGWLAVIVTRFATGG